MCGTNYASEPRILMRHGGKLGEMWNDSGPGHVQEFLTRPTVPNPFGLTGKAAAKFESESYKLKQKITRPVDRMLAKLHVSGNSHRPKHSLFTSHPSIDQSQESECRNSHLFGASHAKSYMKKRQDTFHELETYLKQLESPVDCYPQLCLLYIYEQCKAVGLTECYAPACVKQYEALQKHMPHYLQRLPDAPTTWQAYREWIATFLSCHVSYTDRTGQSTVGTKTELGWALPTYPAELVYPVLYRGGNSLQTQPKKTSSWIAKHVEHRVPSSSMCMNVPDIVLVYHWARKFIAPHSTLTVTLSDLTPVPPPCSMVLQVHAVRHAADIKARGICLNRIWSLASAAFQDTATVALYVGDLTRLAEDLAGRRGGQTKAMSSACDSHKPKCQGATTEFHAEEIDRALEHDPDAYYKTVWSLPGQDATTGRVIPPRILTSRRDYVAISHVWSDGTGIGVKAQGVVNTCLVEYFQRIAKRLGCEGIWWDTISVPRGRRLRELSVGRMHEYYEHAKCIIVHDAELLKTPWSDDGLPLIALALSTWFTRAWTAVELFATRKGSRNVKVLFQDPHSASGDPIIKDLDDDILAFVSRSFPQNFPLPQLGHYLAADMIRCCREGGHTRGDVVVDDQGRLSGAYEEEKRVRCIQDYRIIQAARSTSWVRDRMQIAGLMCLPSQSFKHLMVREGGLKGVHHITQEILKHFRYVELADLVHTAAPVETASHWSWCPSLFQDLGKTRFAMGGPSYRCEIFPNGTLIGKFQAITIPSWDVVEPLNLQASSPTLARVGVGQFIATYCLLLTNPEPSPPPAGQAFMLVEPVGVGDLDGRLQCRFWGWVRIKTSVTIRFENKSKLFSSFRGDLCHWHHVNCRIGDWPKTRSMKAKDWLEAARAQPLTPTEVPGADILREFKESEFATIFFPAVLGFAGGDAC